MTTKKNLLSLAITGLLACAALTACDDNDDASENLKAPTALVTVRPTDDGGFTMQLNNTTVLHPSNVKTSPFGKKEVRALVNYTLLSEEKENAAQVRVNWIDSIRTKLPVATLGADDAKTYGNDPLEIVKDWVTVAEDGYLTLRVRTRWGSSKKKHEISLVTGTNAEKPYEVVLRQNAHGDIDGTMGDALIAFNLNSLPKNNEDSIKITLKWTSFSGEKSTDLMLKMHK